MGPEAKIQREVVKWAKENNFLVYKFHEQFNRFAPDRLFVSPNGMCIWIEFKAFGKTPTSGQARELTKLRAHRCHAYWFDSTKAAINCLKGYDHPPM